LGLGEMGLGEMGGHRPTPRGIWGNFEETGGAVGKNWRAGAQKRQYLWNA